MAETLLQLPGVSKEFSSGAAPLKILSNLDLTVQPVDFDSRSWMVASPALHCLHPSQAPARNRECYCVIRIRAGRGFGRPEEIVCGHHWRVVQPQIVRRIAALAHLLRR